MSAAGMLDAAMRDVGAMAGASSRTAELLAMTSTELEALAAAVVTAGVIRGTLSTPTTQGDDMDQEQQAEPLSSEPMSDERRAEMQRLAEAATSGPWHLEWESCECGDCYPCGHGRYPYAFDLTHRWPNQKQYGGIVEVCELSDADALWIEAATPSTVLSLLAELDRLAAENERLRNATGYRCKCGHSSMEHNRIERSISGKVVAVHYWCTSCACDEMAPVAALASGEPDDLERTERVVAMLEAGRAGRYVPLAELEQAESKLLDVSAAAWRVIRQWDANAFDRMPGATFALRQVLEQP